MKKPTTKNIQFIINVTLGTLIPAIAIFIVYDGLKDLLITINIFETFRITFFVVVSTVSYYGMMNIIKPMIGSFNEYTKNKQILQLLTIGVTICGIVFLIRMWDMYDVPLNHNDRGIILEIIGFFIYLNPVSSYLTSFITGKNENIDHRLMIRTTAIGLITFGLILQFSIFT